MFPITKVDPATFSAKNAIGVQLSVTGSYAQFSDPPPMTYPLPLITIVLPKIGGWPGGLCFCVQLLVEGLYCHQREIAVRPEIIPPPTKAMVSSTRLTGKSSTGAEAGKLVFCVQVSAEGSYCHISVRSVLTESSPSPT